MEFLPIVKAAFKAVFPKGKEIVELSEQTKALLDDYFSTRKEVKSTTVDKASLFLKSFTSTTGSIYEENSITHLISDILKQIKKNSSKKIILVIDDLDRLDPEHIFRLFNIFSSHFDASDKNKFDFDKVIFVCDIENIEQIYQHKYGVNVDFSGYIDKFY